MHCAGVAEEGEEEISDQVEEAARTPSIVAEAMSKSLPESRASSNGSGRQASPAAENVEAPDDNLPADAVEDGDPDQEVPADDSATELPTDDRQDANDEADGQVDVQDDQNEATEQVLLQQELKNKRRLR